MKPLLILCLLIAATASGQVRETVPDTVKLKLKTRVIVREAAPGDSLTIRRRVVYRDSLPDTTRVYRMPPAIPDSLRILKPNPKAHRDEAAQANLEREDWTGKVRMLREDVEKEQSMLRNAGKKSATLETYHRQLTDLEERFRRAGTRSEWQQISRSAAPLLSKISAYLAAGRR